jgi:hypothetical protein
MNTNPDAPIPGRQSAAQTLDRLRRARHGATDHGNVRRLRRFIAQTPHGANMADHHLGAMLPALIRIEAQAAQAAADDQDISKSDETAVMWKNLIERARTLNQWAEACTFPSRQETAVALLRKQK